MFGHDDPVNVIRHQAPCQDAHLSAADVLGHEFEMDAPICLREEDIRAVCSALRDVVGKSGKDTTSVASHPK